MQWLLSGVYWKSIRSPNPPPSPSLPALGASAESRKEEANGVPGFPKATEYPRSIWPRRLIKMRESPQSQSLSSRQAQKKQLSNRARRVMEMRESPQSQSHSDRTHTRAQLGVYCVRSAAAVVGRRHWKREALRRGKPWARCVCGGSALFSMGGMRVAQRTHYE